VTEEVVDGLDKEGVGGSYMARAANSFWVGVASVCHLVECSMLTDVSGVATWSSLAEVLQSCNLLSGVNVGLVIYTYLIV
jgi:hypothetical protein